MQKKLDKSNVHWLFELSMVQKGMLFLHLKEEKESLYNVQLTLNLEGHLDTLLFQQAVGLVQENNESLRAVFNWENTGKPLQVILKKNPLLIENIDLSADKEPLKAMENLLTTKRDHKFDLTELPLSITVIKLRSDYYVVSFTHHHILYDGWSTGIFLKELFGCYDQLVAGKEPQLTSKPGFKMINQHRKAVTDEITAKGFWESYLNGFESNSIFGEGKISLEPSLMGQSLVRIPSSVIEEISKSNHVTQAAVLYATLGLLISKYQSRNDVVFGTTVSDRPEGLTGINQTIGNFINTIPLRYQSNDSDTLIDTIKKQQDHLLERNQYHHTAYGQIKEVLKMKPSDELFDIVMVIENYPLDIHLSNHLSIELNEVHEKTEIPLLITVFFRDELEIEFSYHQDKVEGVDMHAFAEQYKNLLLEASELLNNPVSTISLATTFEKERILNSFNDTKINYSTDGTIVKEFENQVDKSPENLALTFDNESFSFIQLDQLANQIANELIENYGIKAGDLVGVMLERELHLIPVIYGVLKAGGVYVPVEPKYPAKRKNLIIADSEMKCMITRNEFTEGVQSWNTSVTLLEDLLTNIKSQAFKRPKVSISGNDLAYIIHTSGSTGKPKGVMIKHHSVLNRIGWMQKEYPLTQTDVILQKTPIVFDVSIWELFWWSFTGASLHLLDPGAEKDPELITDAVQKAGVTTMHFVPSMLNGFLAHIDEEFDFSTLASLKQVFASGEALKPEQVESFGKTIYANNKTKLVNLYGPTEATVDVSYYECSFDEKIVPIGKPIDNTSLHILDHHGQILPVGISGELCISGAGLATGYLKRADLTAEKFVNCLALNNERIYKTGDLAKWMEDGNIQYLGRIDDQVKVRGYRIELGEIESTILSDSLIKEAAVITKNINGDTVLIAYLKADKKLIISELKSVLEKMIPLYMVPSYFIQLEEFPVNNNGKLDRKALPQPLSVKEEILEVLDNKIDKSLSTIWEEVLGHDQFNSRSNFFDVGGDSIKLITVSSKIKKTLGKKISVTEILNYPSIATLSNYLFPREQKTQPEEKKPISAVSANKDIAVIGMAGKFPGANSVNEFWENLKNGVESIQRKESNQDDPSHVNAKGHLEGHDLFDAAFFSYLPTEAEVMDPQTRIFHECTWEALEEAGYNPQDYEGKIGLYGGATANPYFNLDITANQESWVEKWEKLTYADKDFLCARVAYKLKLRGPVVNINTACSTSLVAIDSACADIISGKCDMALAGGVSVTIHDRDGYVYHKGMILSPDGKCRAFDKEAGGTVGGNGAGVVLLKKLDAAIKDGDIIHAVIKGSAKNNDGDQKIGFTAPSVAGQEEVIKMALQNANVNAESITYIEAHGTATSLGDPVEITALQKAYNTNENQFCGIGSVKTNIGHLDAAAGVAGFIKTVLSLKHQQLVPSLHYQEANEAIDFQNSPFYVNTKLKNWEKQDLPRRAAVSSFGIGGTNAHIILEEAPQRNISDEDTKPQLVLVSGKSPGALKGNLERLSNAINEEVNLADLAYTLQSNRAHHTLRCALTATSNEELVNRLAVHLNGFITPQTSKNPNVVLMFSGQGSQYSNMYADLYTSNKFFRNEVNTCLDIANKYSKADIKGIIFNVDEIAIHQTQYTQPALFILEYAMAKMLLHFGVKPDALIGHSLGEYAAACLSGIFSLEDAIKLVISRGEIMAKAQKGAMISVSATESLIRHYLEKYPQLSIAAINSQDQIVVSGNTEDIQSLAEEIVIDQIEHRILKTSHAFHSAMMDAIIPEFRKVLKSVKFNQSQLPVISNLTGKKAGNDELSTPEYWISHLRNTVRFQDGLEVLLAEYKTIFVEVGPGSALSTFLRTNQSKRNHHKAISLVRHPKQQVNDYAFLLHGLGTMWENGLQLNWSALHEDSNRLKISLPTYAFDHQKFPDRLVQSNTQMVESPFTRKEQVDQWFYAQDWKTTRLRNQIKPSQGILIFADESGLSTHLAEEFILESPFILVHQGQKFERVSENTFRINPDHISDYKTLLNTLKETNNTIDLVIYAWTVSSMKKMDQALNYGEDYRLLRVIQSIKATSAFSDLHITLLTNDQFDVVGGESSKNNAGGLSAILKVIAQENSGISTGQVDINYGKFYDSKYKQLVWKTIGQQRTGEVLAVRNNKVWKQNFEAVFSEGNQTASIFKNKGTYLITGGAGKLGFELTKYLLVNFDANVILTGRTSQENLSVSKKSSVESLGKLGGKVVYFSANSANQKELEAVINQTKEDFGNIDGIVHAAGITDGKSINLLNNLTVEDFQVQYETKLHSLINLHEVHGDKELDFCLIISSVSSYLGGMNFGAYAAANASMDQYFREIVAKKELKNWLLVNFDGIAYDEKGEGIKTAELIKVFTMLPSYLSEGQVVLSVADMEARMEEWVYMQNTIETVLEKVLNIDNDLIEEEMVLLWRSFFGKEYITHQDDFFELGGDSLKVLNLINRIKRKFGADVSLSDFFDYPKLHSIATLVKNSLSIDNQSVSIIKPSEVKAHYPLSSTQKRLYFLQSYEPDSTVYNMPLVLQIAGEFNVEKASAAFNKLIQRHESLRTNFQLVNDLPVQIIKQKTTFNIDLINSGDSLKETISNFIRPFDLSNDSLIRVGVIEESNNNHWLLIDLHHIITDAISKNILIADFTAFYKGQELAAPALQFKDFAVWQNSDEQISVVKENENFWTETFEGQLPVLDLPLDFIRPEFKSFEGNVVSHTLSEALTTRLKELAEKEQSTLYQLILSIYYVLLNKLSQQEDIVIGTPVAGRNHPDLEKIIGMFVNTLPLRNYPTGDLAFKEFFTNVKNQVINSFSHQDYSLENLIDLLKVERDTSRNPLFDASFSFENFEKNGLEIDGLTISEYQEMSAVSKFDLTLIASENNGKLDLGFEYATNLFNPSTVETFAQYFEQIATIISHNHEIRIADIDILSSQDYQRFLVDFNNTDKDHGTGNSVLEGFNKVVQTSPDAPAVQEDGQTLTYQELDLLSTAIAAYLQSEKNIQNGDLIAVLMGCEFYFVPVILGILKAGAAYIPIDIAYPDSRINTIINESKVNLVVNSSSSFNNKNESIKILPTNQLIEEANSCTAELTKSAIDKLDLAYVIFTSGSTGKPKGVMINHESLLNYVNWAADTYTARLAKTFSLHSSISFDLTVTSIFTPLLIGGSIKIFSEEDYGQLITNLISDTQVDVVKLTPSHLKVIRGLELTNKEKNHSRTFIVGGEELTSKLSEDISNQFNGNVEIFNEYGPTEATVGCMVYQFNKKDKGNSVSLGCPADNTEIYLLDKYLKPVAANVPGEVFIAGKGLAAGYLYQDDLTATKFTDHPFKEGEKIYRTGDLAVRDQNGKIFYKGRIDDQVKIRGHRIEIGEIENHLLNHQEINEALVMTFQNAEKELNLVAYYQSDVALDYDTLRNYLIAALPDYMVPSFMIQVAHFDQTVNGKIDRKSLPIPTHQAASEFVSPGIKEEMLLADIFGQILQVELVGIHDNFFALGGDSIKSIQISSRLLNQGYELPVKTIFKYPTVSQLAKELKEITAKIDQSQASGLVELTAIQNWMLDGKINKLNQYNQSVWLNFSNPVKAETIKILFNQLINHHDSLRLQFDNQGNNYLQKYGTETVSVTVNEFDLTQSKEPAKDIERYSNEIQEGIDLSNAPLLQLGLFHCNDGDRLLIVAHHLVMDGVSWRILLADLESMMLQSEVGKAWDLPLKTDSYQKWSLGLSDYRKSKSYQKASDYWTNQNVATLSAIPVDFKTGENRVSDVNELTFNLEENITEKLLKSVHQAYQTNPQEVILSALVMAWKEIFNQALPQIDMESHGREDLLKGLNIQRTIGWFTSIYPVSLKSPSNSVNEILKSVKESLRQVPNKGFDYLMWKEENKDSSLNSEVSFNYLGQFDTENSGDLFTISNESKGNEIGLTENRFHKWDVSAFILGNQLQVSLKYSDKQYKIATGEAMKESFERNLVNLITHLDGKDLIGLTASDFTYSNLEDDQLNKLSATYEIEDIYSISPMQEGLFFQSLIDTDTDQYFEQMTYEVNGKLDLSAVEESLNKLFERHAVLRTAFVKNVADRPLQIVDKSRKANIRLIDLTKSDENQEIMKIVHQKEDRAKGFNLAEEALLRVTILQFSDEKFIFIWSHHHIIMDGWCRSIILQDFVTIYQNLTKGETTILSEVYPYADFIQWLENKDEKPAERFWKNYLNSYENVASLPKSELLIDESKRQVKSHQLKIDQSLTNELQEFSKQNSLTFNTIVQTAWGILLAKYNQTTDVVFGSVVSGRPSEVKGIENMVGLFINTIPVRVKYEQNQSLLELLKENQQNSLAAQEHQYLPLSDIQQLSDQGSTLLDHILIIENYPVSDQINNLINQDGSLGYTISGIEMFEQNNYDFSVMVLPGEEVTIDFNYNAQVYDQKLIEQVGNHFLYVMNQLITLTTNKAHQIEVLSNSEKLKVLNQFNQTSKELAIEQTIHGRFEETVVNHAFKNAVTCAGESITYEELNNKSNQLARKIKAEVAGKEAVVGIMMPRSVEMIISIMAVLKAGLCYVPIDPTYPADRVKYIAEESETKLLLTTENCTKGNDYTCQLLFINNAIFTGNESNLENTSEGSDLAYVIFTSGSTGKPKGVMVAHNNIINFVEGVTDRIPILAHKSILSLTTISFDIFVLETILPLLCGLEVILADDSEQKDLQALSQLITEKRADIVQITPSHLKLFLMSGGHHSLNTVKHLLVGGEAFPEELLRDLKSVFEGRIFNMYGPTETTVWSAIRELTEKDTIDIGTPIANTSVRILHSDLTLQPVGVAGELWIGGKGVAKGYWKNADLTYERFIEDPYSKNERIYQTGDLAKWNTDGTIQYLGRVDNQVKIRGFRIELGEIESLLNAHQNIETAVVAAKEVTGEKQLVAYYLCNEEVSKEEMTQYLALKLPDYMIPAYYVELTKFPLTPNGKINRKALPDPELMVTDDFLIPETETEEKIRKLWSEVLETEQEKISTNMVFFQIGGHSLKAMLLANKLFRKFDIDVPIQELFELDTIKKQSDYIENAVWAANPVDHKKEAAQTGREEFIL